MAKNYTFAEAVKIINEGTDLEALVDIGRRYPVLLQKVTKVCAKAGEDFVELMSFMPEYLTANKVNTAIKALITGEGSGEDSGTEDSGDDVGEGTGDGGKDYESMSAKQLWEILKKAGKQKTAKSTKKADLVAACKAMDAGEDSEDAGDDEDAGEENGNPYDGKTAMELFKECKKRGIKAAPKKPAKFYADLLTKDDAKSDDAGDDGEDWDEDGEDAGEEKETKTEKKGAKAEKATGKKTGKAAKKDEDDGDDWDI